jgi:hypothetical protein
VTGRPYGDAGSVADGAGDTIEDGDELGVGVRVALGVGLAVRDGCGELVAGLGLVGVTVGAELAGTTVAGVVAGPVVPGALLVADGGLTHA